MIVFSKQMIIGLLADRSMVFGNRLIPIVGIAKLGIYIENNTPKGVFFVAHDLAQMIFCI